MSPASVQVDRLRASQDIRRVLGQRTRRAGRFLVVHVHDREDGDPSRFAVVASRRVGTAVARNRAKRVLREALRDVTWRAGHDVVVVARGDAATAHLAEVVGDLRAIADHLELREPAA